MSDDAKEYLDALLLLSRASTKAVEEMQELLARRNAGDFSGDPAAIIDRMGKLWERIQQLKTDNAGGGHA